MTHVLKSGPDAGIPVRVIGRIDNTVSVRTASHEVHVVDETEIEEEPTDRELPNTLFARRIANYVRFPENAEHNKTVITASILHFNPNLYTRTLPDWAKSDTAIVAAAIRKGWSGVYNGRDTELALLMLKKSQWINPNNVPEDQNWLEANVLKHHMLWSYLEPERQEKVAVRMVSHGNGNFDCFLPYRDSLKPLKDAVPAHLHTALEEAQAARWWRTDKHHDMVTVSCCVANAAAKDMSTARQSLQCREAPKKLRAIPLPQLASVCERGVAVGLATVGVARLLRDELRKRKTPLRDITEEIITFLGAHLPEEEARELVVKTAGVSKKRDLAAFLEDF